MAAVEPKTDGLQRTLKDLLAGAAGGIAQVLLGQSSHPFLARLNYSSSILHHEKAIALL